MVQIKVPVRAYKRLIYITFASSFLCFLALHLAISYQHVQMPLDLQPDGGHRASGQVFRGLLQKMPLDYSAFLTPSETSTHGANSSVTKVKPSAQSRAIDSVETSKAQSFAENVRPSATSDIIVNATLVPSQPKSFTPDYISQYLDAEPQVDNSPGLSENQILTELEKTNNLAVSYWLKSRKYAKKQSNNGKSCHVDFPSLYELQYNNIYWQKFVNGNSSFYLYGAYYDDRWRGGPLPMVRILAMVDRIKPPPTLCQIWFDRITVPIISQATYIYGWYSKWGNYNDGILQPYIITCKIPRIKGLPKNLYPASVSLVENRCNKATNSLKIINDRPEQKKEFAVCVKGLDFLHEDLSVRMVEWIELLRLLGASKIFLYELEIHPNITKVLDHYQKDGIVELTKITLPGNQPNYPGFRHLYLKNKLTHKRQNELIPYNDCLYRNLYSYDYLALLDIDEVIMPIMHSNWSDLMKEVQRRSFPEKNYTRASYNVRNVYFLDDLGQHEEQMRHEAHEIGIPRYLHMLQHVYRSQNYTKPGQYVKCFHNTERVVSLHNHFPLNCLGTCTTYSIPVELAHLQHYRKDCVGPLKKSCKEFRTYTTRDTTIFRYKDELVLRTTRTLNTLGFFHQNSSTS